MGKIITMSMDNQVEKNFAGVVVKQESEAGESSNNCLDHRTEATSTVDYEMSMSGFQGNQFETSGLSVGIVKVKQEFKEESEITRDLVGLFPGSGEWQDQKPLPEVKNESDPKHIKEEIQSDASFNSDKFAACMSNEQIETCVTPWNISQVKSEPCYDTKSFKLLNVSVKLEDLFPSQVRKLGKAHSNSSLCLCLYCQGEYKCTNDPCVSKNLQGEKRPTLVQNLNEKLKNGRSGQQGAHLKGHQKVSSNKMPLQCKKCSIKCEDRSALRIHMSEHPRKKTYTCKLCHEKFTLMSSHLSHLSEVHNVDKPFKCEQCPLSFWYRSVLETHSRAHSKERPFKCEQCSAKFTQDGTLKVHMRIHKDQKAFKCAQCPANFKISSNLNVHLKVHSGEKSFKCMHCPLRFMTSTNLKNHSRIHNQEKPFKCNQCPAKFVQSGGLKLHLRVHSGERPYKCQLCSSRFAQSSGLSTHIKNAHSDVRPFACNVCPAKFKWRVALNAHSRVHSGEKPFHCKQCPAGFKYLSGLHSHIKIWHSDVRPFQCALCPANYKLKSALKVHLRIHLNDKPYECNLCRAKFTHSSSLKSHLNVHSSEKPLACAHCTTTFKLKRSLIKHLETFH